MSRMLIYSLRMLKNVKRWKRNVLVGGDDRCWFILPFAPETLQAFPGVSETGQFATRDYHFMLLEGSDFCLMRRLGIGVDDVHQVVLSKFSTRNFPS